ncbi:SBBP repeat-containing protein [Cytophagaceae bacterium YF14B1]|uniref:SBBP repeat-containing protein n=1 Tax=Xanthocytophaga flava TaxID=3048013 RepID=A0AAE3QYM4_9BACT|nr:SBBP repeat-containing protein [Xanthocytophaga flavus]MDJ1485636.1 SBBP repeat-containing protein [Xanthocytophaga flavus]
MFRYQLRSLAVFCIAICMLILSCKKDEVSSSNFVRDIAGDMVIVATYTDTEGNLYITGNFSGVVTLDSITLTSKGDYDILLAKYDGLGNILWARSAGNIEKDEASDIVVDNTGNIYLAGNFYGNTTFESTSLLSHGDKDVFWAKYDSEAKLLWAKSAGGIGKDEARSLATDVSGRPYLTGAFSETVIFGSSSVISHGGTDVFVARLDNLGSVQWVKQMGESGNDSGCGIAVDGLGNIFVAGFFVGSVTLDNLTYTSYGGKEGFVIKMNADGEIKVVHTANGFKDDEFQSIVVDKSNNVYITGYFTESADFDGVTYFSAGDADICIVRLDTTGAKTWQRTSGGAGKDISYGIALDRLDNVYITGYFNGSAKFGSVTITSSGEDDVFVVKYNNLGDIQWVKSAGSSSIDSGNDVATSPDNNVYIAGHHTNDIVLDGTKLTGTGPFLWKVKQ